MSRTIRCSLILIALLAVTGTLQAQVAPEKPPVVADRAYQHPDLDIQAYNDQVRDLPAQAAAQVRQRLARLGVNESSARVDRRGGRFVTLLPSEPMVPGAGNSLRQVGQKSRVVREKAAADAFAAFVRDNQADLGIASDEISGYKVTSYGDTLYRIYAPRSFDGIPVRGSYVGAVINNGNLNLMTTQAWDERPAPSGRPQLTLEDATLAAEGFMAPLAVMREWDKGELLYVPMANGNAPQGVGNGYRYQLVWSVKLNVEGDLGNWELLVDAHDGEILSSLDTNQYAEVKGGVYPVTNDQVPPDGVEQAGWPMPFQDVSTGTGPQTTDTGGNVAATGSMTATFYGPYVEINDNCGAASLTQNDGIDWGTSGGTDCVTPGFGGPGNTHASRTGFYELNKIIEMARGQLPSNSWLQARLTSNVNINGTCAAHWSGSAVNFYRSGGSCFNTGENAGVLDHEWGHGMDANDATPGISGDGIADVYAALRLNSSCIGRNFRPMMCTGYGDPCLTCTGVRDIDYLKRQSGNPHDYTWSNANCGGTFQCIGGVYSEAIWSLWKRLLQAAPYNMDNNTAHEVTNRLTFLGAGNTGTWFSGGPPNGGCGGSSGYMNFLAVDDDNGDINDGTPHMTAIYTAFNDQEIACQTPAVQDSGCANTPTVAPVVTTGSGNQLVTLSWGAVPNAVKYGVYRTEGVFQCDFGKVKLGETTGTTWNDSGVQNGRDYSYVVIPMGPADSCFGPASACTTGAGVGQPDFSVSCVPSSHTIEQGTGSTATCTVISSFGYTGTVSLSCSGNPAGIGCSFAPPSVSPPADGSAASTLTISVDPGQALDSYNFDVVGDDGSGTRSSGVSVQVTPAGQNGPQNAVFDAGLGAPKCAVPGSSCDTQGLVDGRANLGPEPNQPNTLDGCADGTSGTYHSDESNDRVVVRTLDMYDFAEGVTVEVEATVWAWSTGSSDTADFYYAADADNPVWTYIGSVVPSGGGVQVLTRQYTLPAGSLQAVRVNYRYGGTAGPCTTDLYDDRDDLVFAVNSGCGCVSDADCDDGLFCNGSEICNSCTCLAGTAVNCDDGVSCTDDVCNEGTQSCDNTANDANCDNGLFCDGVETCDAVLDCQAGPGDPCAGGETCDEVNDVCVGSCAPVGASCTVPGDCCSNKCKGKPGSKTCR